jgi:hypothetical protein
VIENSIDPPFICPWRIVVCRMFVGLPFHRRPSLVLVFRSHDAFV